jgi:glycosyltransferase involved in cell wall biosynthesis
MTQPATNPLPRISVVVPNFNYGRFLDQTLRSIIEQGYPNLELIVVDGGSSDDSVDVIRRHEASLAWWVSEKDRGQSHAINKGLQRATGDVVNWLCSDDRLAPGALHRIAAAFAADPTLDVLVGRCRYEDQRDGRSWTDHPRQERMDLIPTCFVCSQPSTFFRRTLLQRSEPVDESYHYAMDWELWAYLHSRGARFVVIDDVLSVCGVHGQSKTDTAGDRATREIERVYRTYVAERVPLTFWYRRLLYPLDRFRARHPGPLTTALVRPAKFALRLALAPFYGYRRAMAINWSGLA